MSSMPACTPEKPIVTHEVTRCWVITRVRYRKFCKKSQTLLTWRVENAERQRATEKNAPEIIKEIIGPMFNQVLNHNFRAPSGSRL